MVGRKLGMLLLMISCSLLGVACFDSCEPPFPPGNNVDKFRVLAIKAEPPEVSPGGRTQMSFLSATPEGLVVGKVTFPPSQCFGTNGLANPSAIWIACLPQKAGSGSPVGCTDVSALGLGGGGQDAGSPSDTGPGSIPEGIQILFPPCGPLATWLVPQDALDGQSNKDKQKGLDAQVVLAATKGELNQISVKRVKLSTKPADQQNTNPRLTGFTINDLPVTSCRTEDPEKCEPHTYAANQRLVIKVTQDPKSQDPITDPNDPRQKREDFRVDWYATAGEFNLSSTFISGEEPPRDSPWPEWYPNDYKGADLKEGTELTIIAIARDLRGGTDWLAVRIKLGPPVSRD